MSDHRSWFGPKRVGYGLRPQTWQGWLVVLAPLAAVLVAVGIIRWTISVVETPPL